jgi:malic enzyme
VGLAVVACKAYRVTDKMFYLAAKTLGNLVTEEDISVGLLYPRVSRIRSVSFSIAVEVAKLIFEEDLCMRARHFASTLACMRMYASTHSHPHIHIRTLIPPSVHQDAQRR